MITVSDDQPHSSLHLSGLFIKGFRGIETLKIPRLGRVTLIVGKNGVGKTTILEACQIYAARARYRVLSDLVNMRDEFSSTSNEDGGKISMPDIGSLFYGRIAQRLACIEISPQSGAGKNRLKIEVVQPSESQMRKLERFLPDNVTDDNFQVLNVAFDSQEFMIPWLIDAEDPSIKILPSYRPIRRMHLLYGESDVPPQASCTLLGPGIMQNDQVADLWDNVALTKDEPRVIDALRLVLGEPIERVAMIGDGERRSSGRRPIVKLSSQEHPVPLRSLGDGATRFFGVALALANSRNGFLLIDEAENGIHYSVQADFWRMVLRTAHENNIQVIATTHGWDCVRGFAQAAIDFQDANGILVRLERKHEQIKATEYSEKELQVAADQGIEVR